MQYTFKIGYVKETQCVTKWVIENSLCALVNQTRFIDKVIVITVIKETWSGLIAEYDSLLTTSGSISALSGVIFCKHCQ